MSDYQLTSQAQSDLEAIVAYVTGEGSVEQAVRVLSKLQREFRLLARTPGIGHFREDLWIGGASFGESTPM
ncbi:MAG: type II toxin-antitoxin system RelE/ParE family toxin [Phycisphaerae bacterium]|nr:type II toxin-antitoxin system RelE/ParE family toxin [Phycisphaerae bacterium]